LAAEGAPLLSRERLKKIASLGHQAFDPPIRSSARRNTDLVRLSSKQKFLTLLWARIFTENGLLNPDSLSLGGILSDFQNRLSQISHPIGQNRWIFFDPTASDQSAEEFWRHLCNPEFSDLWKFPETIGWAYQYFIQPGLDIFRSSSGPKINPSVLALRTQQFTPQWIADFLVQNTLGRLWLTLHPDSALGSTFSYHVPQMTFLPPADIKHASQIKILDPACGAMHLGLPALRLMRRIYREELENAGKSGWPDAPGVQHESQIDQAIIQNNLFGVDIDPLAIELATLTLLLELKGNLSTPLNLFCHDTLKRYSRTNLPRQFQVLLLNPPYLDKRDYHPRLKQYMANHYKQSGRNLYTAFLERSLEFLAPNGRLGAITPQTFMFIRSFAGLRKNLLDQTVIESLVHTGLNTFDDAVVDCAFYVLRKEPDPQKRQSETGRYLQLTALTTPEEKHAQMMRILSELHQGTDPKVPCCYRYPQAYFSDLPDSPWVYWISPHIRQLFNDLPSLGEIAELRQGLATTDNERFLRYWWEIPKNRVAWNCTGLSDAETSGKKWFPYMKSGGYVQWYGCRKFLVNWGQNGREIKEEILRRYPYLKGSWQWVAKNTDYYFREGITYSYLTSGKFSARFAPAGSIFDVAGSSIFSSDPWLVLAILNSRWCRFALSLINSTVNFQVGDLQRLPVPRQSCPEPLKKLVLQAIDIAKFFEMHDETSPDFVAPLPWPDGCQIVREKNKQLMEIQHEVDQWVYQLYDLGPDDRNLIERQTAPDELLPTLDQKELAYRWISYAVGTVFGRYAHPARMHRENMYPLVPTDHEGLALEVRNALEQLTSPESCRQIIDLLSPSGHLHQYLSQFFFKQHFNQFQHRPIYWLLKRKKQLLAVYYHTLAIKPLSELNTEWNLKLSDSNMILNTDKGITANIKPFRKYLALSSWKKICR